MRNQSKSPDPPMSTLVRAQAAERCGAYESAIRLYSEYSKERTEFSTLVTGSIKRCLRRANSTTRSHHHAPIASIVIPCFNSAPYIEECISSVLAQTASRIEIIVVDDGSSDQTPQILRRLKKSDPRIRLITNDRPSGSPGVPRNQALRLCKGKYIGFIDSDDRVEPDYFESMLIQAISRRADVVITTGFVNMLSDGTRIQRRYKQIDQINYDSEDLSCNHLSSMIWDKIYERDLLINNDIRLGSYPAAVDVPFIFKVYFHCKNPVVDNNHGYFYRRESPGSVTVKHRKSSSCDFELQAFADSFKWAQETRVSREYLNYMRMKQLTSCIYTLKLIPTSFLLSLIHI